MEGEIHVFGGGDQIGEGGGVTIGVGGQISEAGGGVTIGVEGQISEGGGVNVGVGGQFGEAVGVNGEVKDKDGNGRHNKPEEEEPDYCWWCGKNVTALAKQPNKPGVIHPYMRHLLDCEVVFNMKKNASHYYGLKGEKI